jgi:hypothetical protein
MQRNNNMCSELGVKQKLALEIIEADSFFEKLAKMNPESRSIINPLRNTLGVIVHLAHGVDVREFCSPFDRVEELK